MTATIEEAAATTEAPARQGVLIIPGMPEVRWTVTDQASVDAARATFTRHHAELKMGAATATMTDPATGEQQLTKTDAFNPEAERIIMWHQHQGG